MYLGKFLQTTSENPTANKFVVRLTLFKAFPSIKYVILLKRISNIKLSSYVNQSMFYPLYLIPITRIIYWFCQGKGKQLIIDGWLLPVQLLVYSPEAYYN